MQKHGYLIYILIIVFGLTALMGCGGDKATNVLPELGTFSCDIDGVPFTATINTWTNQYPVLDYLTMTEFGGTGLFAGDTISIAFYMNEDGEECPCISMFGGFTGIGPGFYSDDSVIDFIEGDSVYSTAHPGAHGTVTMFFSSSIGGTFSFTAYSENETDSIAVTGGVYNLILPVED